MATTWIRPLHINKGKSIAKTLSLRTDYAMNPDKPDKLSWHAINRGCIPSRVNGNNLHSFIVEIIAVYTGGYTVLICMIAVIRIAADIVLKLFSLFHKFVPRAQRQL